MIKYVLNSNGTIFDRERCCTFPTDTGNVDYQAYLKWVDEGNTAIPAPESTFYDLVGDEWVYNPDTQTIADLNAAILTLESKVVELFSFLYALFDVLKTKEVITNLDFSQDLRQKAATWKTLLDQIELYTT